MPFTLAHPAAVVPLARGRLVPAALVLGAVAPDVGYYVPGTLRWAYPTSAYAHSLAGMFTIDLLVGVIAYGLWRAVFRRPVLALLPDPWRSHAARDTARAVDPRSLAGWGWLALSVLIGAATHLLLDVVTHDTGPIGPGIGALDAPLMAGTYRWWWLQFGLSVVGLAALAWWLWRWVARVGAPRALLHAITSTAWLSLGVLALAMVAAAAWAVRSVPQPESAMAVFTTGVIAAAIGGQVAAVVLVAAWWLQQRPARPPVRGREHADGTG